MAGARHAAAFGHERFGKQAAITGKGEGALQSGLVYLFFNPAMLQQLIQYPHRLFAAGTEAAFGEVVVIFVVAVVGQRRCTYQGFLKDFQHGVAGQCLSVIGTAGAVQTLVQFAQTFHDLSTVFTGQRAEELPSFLFKKHTLIIHWPG